MNDFGLYIHWPFCIKKCPYCNFNTYVFEHNQQDWVNGILLELEQYNKYFNNYLVDSIFFGGGTPSLIEPKYIKQILNKVNSLWKFKNKETEITLETNPSSIETHKLEEFMISGINRFSIGIQSLNDNNLKFLGRLHNAQEAIEILSHACKICPNVSADFIYALPNQKLSDWKKELQEILLLANKINLKHISLYQLSIEENTPFEKDVFNNKWQPSDNNLQNILYRYTNKELNKNNWEFYEISNAKKYNGLKAKHNLKYWNYENYLGIGAGAHSRMSFNNKKFKFNNILAPFKWLNYVNSNIIDNNDFENHKLQQIQDFEQLSPKNQFIEQLLMVTRLNKTLPCSLFNNEYINQEKLNILKNNNFIKIKNNEIKFNLKGKLMLNSCLKYILQ